MAVHDAEGGGEDCRVPGVGGPKAVGDEQDDENSRLCKNNTHAHGRLGERRRESPGVLSVEGEVPPIHWEARKGYDMVNCMLRRRAGEGISLDKKHHVYV